MTTAIRAGLLVTLALVGCAPGGGSATGSATQAEVSTNGIGQNGLSTNGIWQNGIWQNGIWQNGIWQNGIWQNGIWQNGIWQNGIWQNGIWQNGIWQNNLPATELLKTNPYAAKLLQYVYGCAMPPGKEVILDPYNGTLPCDAAGACGTGYTCTASNTCVIDLKGSIGVGVNSDGVTTWADDGFCDETCQRWVSACVLARTNAYGVKVDISLRAPDTAPAKIRQRLALATGEATEFSLREGSYYGNLFATTPVNPAPDNSLFVNTPSFYACAGPGSNVPQVTKRFCSSQGDNGPIHSVGTCEQACTGLDDPTIGAERSCFTSIATGAQTDANRYDQVLTVYLRQPIAACGNSVCETGEDATSCPTDCQPGWAISNQGSMYSAGTYTIGPNTNNHVAVGPDGSVIIAGPPNRAGGATIEGTVFPTGHVVVAKYAADGSPSWAVQGSATGSSAVAVASDGTIISITAPFGPDSVRINRFTPAGVELTPIVVATTAGASVDNRVSDMVVDGSGNIFLLGDLTNGTVTYGGTTLTSCPAGSTCGSINYVVKLTGTGTTLWAKQVLRKDGFWDTGAGGLAVDGNGDVIVATPNDPVHSVNGGLYKLGSADGTSVWPGPVLINATAVTTDAANNIFTIGAVTDPTGDLRLIETSPAGDQIRQATLWPKACATCTGTIQNDLLQPARISIDHAGNLVFAVWGAAAGAGVIANGIEFQTYAAPNVFLASYDPTLQFRWAKQIPFVLSGGVAGLTLDGSDNLILTGTYGGSMLAGGRLLVTENPVDTLTLDTYVMKIGGPSPSTTQPQIITTNGTTENIVLEATSAAGAEPWFTKPAALDAAGVNVVCDPPPTAFYPVGTAPSHVYPIGTTLVTCTASDPLGNQSTTTFTVTVRDTTPPVVTNVGPINKGATSSSGAVVTFTPVATDQIDGARPITCTPASGSLFPLGTTQVSCSASDTSNNRVSLTFPVTVGDTTPPVVTVPASIVAEATSASGAAVTFAASATDDQDGVLPATCDAASGSTFALGTHTVTCSARDAAGNVGTASFTISVVDTTPPVIGLPANIATTATAAAGSIVTYSASATDLVDGAVAVTCTPPSGSTFAPGTTTVACTAIDAHGNQATATFTVAVTLSWSGVLPPINADGSSIFKLGQVVPVKFALTGASAGITNANATLTLAKITNAVTGTDVEASSSGNADTGNTFRYSNGQYIYNLDTKPLTTGTWRLTIDLHDGVSRTVIISLAK